MGPENVQGSASTRTGMGVRKEGAALVAGALVLAALLALLGVRQSTLSEHGDSAAMGFLFGAALVGISVAGRRATAASHGALWLILLAGTAAGITVLQSVWYPGLGLGAGIVLATLVPLALAAWVAMDAPSQNLLPIPWTLVATLLPVIGFAIYLIVRELKPRTSTPASRE